MLGEIKTTVPAEDESGQVGSGSQVDTGASDITDDEKEAARETHRKMILQASSFSTQPIEFRNSPLTDFEHFP